MNVVVFNGSPKGKSSVTMQSVKYLENHFKQLSTRIFNISEKINTICKDEQYFNDIISQVKDCDMVLWVYPVYGFSVPSQLIKFVELVCRTDAFTAFEGKASAQICTSLLGSGETAQNYIRQVCEDFNMSILPAFSALSSDLLKPQCRKSLIDYGSEIIFRCENKVFFQHKFPHPIKPLPVYLPYIQNGLKKVLGKIVLVTDCADVNSNLFKLLDYFLRAFNYAVDIVSLNEIDAECGCNGCLQCYSSGKCCLYDGLGKLIKDKIADADCIIYACDIVNHSLGGAVKQLTDRLFCYGKKAGGKVEGYILSGDITAEPVVCDYIEKKSLSGGSCLAGIVSDCFGRDDIVNAINGLCAALEYAVVNRPQRSKSNCSPDCGDILKEMLYTLHDIDSGKTAGTFTGLNNVIRAFWLEYQLTKAENRDKLYKAADKDLLLKYQEVVGKL